MAGRSQHLVDAAERRRITTKNKKENTTKQKTPEQPASIQQHNVTKEIHNTRPEVLSWRKEIHNTRPEVLQ